MGGCGSGSRGSSHNTVDHSYILDASRWMRAGILYPYQSFHPAGVWRWALVRGERRREFSIQYQVDTTGPDATARLIYSLENADGPLDYVVRPPIRPAANATGRQARDLRAARRPT
jgi:hypothetical protein